MSFKDICILTDFIKLSTPCYRDISEFTGDDIWALICFMEEVDDAPKIYGTIVDVTTTYVSVTNTTLKFRAVVDFKLNPKITKKKAILNVSLAFIKAYNKRLNKTKN